MVNTDTGIFEYLPTIFLFPISPAECLIKNISKQLFHLIRFSTEIVEFHNEKFPKIISTEDGIWKKFLETDSNSMSLEK